MQVYVPTVGNYRMNSETSRRNSATQCCQKCMKLSDKVFQLHQCRHHFCKRCLSEYSEGLSSWTDEPDYFPCPTCGVKGNKPVLAVDKRTRSQGFKISSKFYAQNIRYDTEFPEEQNEQETGSDSVEENDSKEIKKQTTLTGPNATKHDETHIGSDTVDVRDSMTRKSKAFNRTAVRFSTYDSSKGFSSRISSDEKDCLYFGGDVMKNGDILLADWANRSLKLFKPSGQFICSCKLAHPPLDVTVVRSDMVVVSFGSTCKTVVFLIYKNNVLAENGSYQLAGFLFGTTKYEDGCIGIYEKDGSRPSIVKVVLNKGKVTSYGGRRTVAEFITPDNSKAVSSESGIYYNQRTSRLYVTSRRRLFCYNKDRQLLFEKRFPCGEETLYFLGSVTCDVKGETYIASDYCILRVTADGDLIAIVPAQDDPYHILSTKEQSTLVLIGKTGNVVCKT